MATGAQAMDAAKQFNFQGDVTAAEPYGEGHINDTFLITTKEGTETSRYILQRINTHVFKEPEKLMENVVAVTQYLENATGGEAQTETLRVIPTKSGGAVLRYGRRCVLAGLQLHYERHQLSNSDVTPAFRGLG